jgi:hypothetical protein
MGIPESQLETWSHQGAVITAKATADSVKYALNTYKNWPDSINYESFLQGSYKNNTNIRGDMDVDVVARLDSTFYSNLTEEQKRQLGLTPSSYGLSEFRNDVKEALKDYFGSESIAEGDKSLKIESNNNRLPSDVVVCAKYRKYYRVDHNSYVEGITFWTKGENRQVINYPQIHYDNGVKKRKNTSNCYKQTVRMFKNIRNYLIENESLSKDNVPSYFLECLIYNAPNEKFENSYQNSFCNIVNWINAADLSNFVCQNEQIDLFGSIPEQWAIDEAESFIEKLISLWNNW